MTLIEIREGAYLELYAIGQLSEAEASAIEIAIDTYPELKSELNEIEDSLQYYAEAHAIQPSFTLKETILKKARAQNSRSSDTIDLNTSSTPKPPSLAFKILLLALMLSSLGLLMTLITKQHRLDVLGDKYSQEKIICETESKNLKERIALLEALQNDNNSIIKIDPTDKYPDTKIYIHTNPASKKNFIQVQELPPLAADQSFQLWSLKGDSDPIPLNVFDGDINLLEVDFIEGTSAYAITIEDLGGSQTPNLANLIGVFSISS